MNTTCEIKVLSSIGDCVVKIKVLDYCQQKKPDYLLKQLNNSLVFKKIKAEIPDAIFNFLWLLENADSKGELEITKKHLQYEFKNSSQRSGNRYDFVSRLLCLQSAKLISVNIYINDNLNLNENNIPKTSENSLKDLSKTSENIFQESFKSFSKPLETPETLGAVFSNKYIDSNIVTNNSINKLEIVNKQKKQKKNKSSKTDKSVLVLDDDKQNLDDDKQKQARAIVEHLHNLHNLTVTKGGAGVSKGQYFADMTVAKQLLANFTMEQVIEAIEFIKNDKYIGASAFTMAKIKANWTFYQNREKELYLSRQNGYNNFVKLRQGRPQQVTEIKQPKTDGIVDLKDVLK